MQSVGAFCNNRNSVEAMATMLKNCNLGRSNIGKLSVDNIGYHGWAILGKVFFQQLQDVGLISMPIVSRKRKDQNHLGIPHRIGMCCTQFWFAIPQKLW